MAIKKSDLYSSLLASCDALRGGMDASQYKDYVLFMLFIKYISDKYGNSDDFAPPVIIPKGASFKDMIALKGKSDIGDKINTQIIQPLIDVNARLARSDFPNFNDPEKLGEGAALVERLTAYADLLEQQLDAKGKRKAARDDLDKKIDAKYPKLTEAEIKTLVVDDKWMTRLQTAVQGELDRVSQTLTSRIRELAERYATPLPHLERQVATLAACVEEHLKSMGATWN